MKIPRRPFYPVPLPPDLFGLYPLPSLLETDDERRTRIAAVVKGVGVAFDAAVKHLGEDEARLLFARVVRRHRRGRGQGRVFAPDRDARLLEEYDAAIRRGDTNISAIARRLRAEGTKLGNTAGAIAAQIRKLRDERKDRERAAAREARRWRMATRGETTLLSAARNAK